MSIELVDLAQCGRLYRYINPLIKTVSCDIYHHYRNDIAVEAIDSYYQAMIQFFDSGVTRRKCKYDFVLQLPRKVLDDSTLRKEYLECLRKEYSLIEPYLHPRQHKFNNREYQRQPIVFAGLVLDIPIKPDDTLDVEDLELMHYLQNKVCDDTILRIFSTDGPAKYLRSVIPTTTSATFMSMNEAKSVTQILPLWHYVGAYQGTDINEQVTKCHNHLIELFPRCSTQLGSELKQINETIHQLQPFHISLRFENKNLTYTRPYSIPGLTMWVDDEPDHNLVNDLVMFSSYTCSVVKNEILLTMV